MISLLAPDNPVEMSPTDKSIPDLEELFDQYMDTDDRQLQEEIVQTIQEIVMPESMIVDLQEEFELKPKTTNKE